MVKAWGPSHGQRGTRTVVWGKAPAGLGVEPCSGAEPWSGGQGVKPTEAESFLAFAQPEKLANLSYNLFFAEQKKLSDAWESAAWPCHGFLDPPVFQTWWKQQYCNTKYYNSYHLQSPPGSLLRLAQKKSSKSRGSLRSPVWVNWSICSSVTEVGRCAFWVKLEKVAVMMYCHRKRCSYQVKIFWGFAPELQRSPMWFYLNSLCGTTLMPLAVCTMAGNEADYQNG